MVAFPTACGREGFFVPLCCVMIMRLGVRGKRKWGDFRQHCAALAGSRLIGCMVGAAADAKRLT